MSQGPSGFINLRGVTFVVDCGRIYQNGQLIGLMFEDGLLKDTRGPFGETDYLRPIEDISGCEFQGTDAAGTKLVLPGEYSGPSGTLSYNGVSYQVYSGRIADEHHRYLGDLKEDGSISVRDSAAERGFRSLSETSLLHFNFDGVKSDGDDWRYEHLRSLAKRGQSYAASETIRYFQGFAELSDKQQKYVLETMSLWASTGLLQLVRKSEGDCSLGNVRHGAAGVTGVRTGNVTLDRGEFEQEVDLYAKFGALMVVSKTSKSLIEVRINLVVAHEFGHQLEFVLTQAAQEKIAQLYDKRMRVCEKRHVLPSDYDGQAELVEPSEIGQRDFFSGYGRTSLHEYWAECVAAFSVKESRDKLKEVDPAIYELLKDIIVRPTAVLRLPLHDVIMELQASLRLGGVFKPEL